MHLFKRILFCGLVAAGCLTGILGGTGCRKLKPSSAGMVVESFPSTTIKVNSRYFEKRFEVTRYAAVKDEHNRLRVSISLRNLKGDTSFEYRYRWLDAHGIEVPSHLTIWQQMATGGGEEALLTGIAPHRDVDDFILDIRLFYSSARW